MVMLTIIWGFMLIVGIIHLLMAMSRGQTTLQADIWIAGSLIVSAIMQLPQS